MADELSRRLAAYESDLVATLQVGPVEAVRARGERRRNHTYAAVVAAVLAVVLGGAAVAGGRVAGGTRAGEASDGWISPEDLAGLTLPHEGEAGYTLGTSVGEPSAVQPCADWGDRPLPYAAIADPTRTGRIAARTVTARPGPGSLHPGQLDVLTSQVLLFTSADLAAGAVRELVDGVSACGWMTSEGASEGAYTWLGGQRSLAGGDPETKVVESALVYRTGNAVAIVFSHETERADASIGAAAGAAMTGLVGWLCSVASCERDAPLLFSEFPSVNPPQTYGPSEPPSPAPPYPTPLVAETPPPSETPPLGGASPP